jgi:hypothetical protein
MGIIVAKAIESNNKEIPYLRQGGFPVNHLKFLLFGKKCKD